jgi:hypothetical protein
MMRLHECQSCDEHDDAGEIDERWNLSVVKVRLNQRELREEYHGNGRAKESTKLPGIRHRGLRSQGCLI